MFNKIEDWFLNLKFVDDTWIESLYFSICRLFSKILDIIYYKPKNFLYNLFVYRKFLTNNFWFDYSYLLQMIQIKLKNDAKRYRKYGIALDANKYAEQMEYCVSLLDRIIEDEYDEKEFENRNIDLSMSDKWLNENENKLFYDAIVIADEKRKQDIKELFDCMNENIQYWWD